MKPAFFKKVQRGGAEVQTPAPHFLSGHPVHKAGEALYPKVALVLPSRPNGDGVPRYVVQQLIGVRFGRSDELPAQGNGHFEVDFVGVNAFFRLFDNNLLANPACEVENGQVGIDFLFGEGIRFPVEVDQSQRVFEVAEAGFNPPAQMIEGFYVLQRERARQ